MLESPGAKKLPDPAVLLDPRRIPVNCVKAALLIETSSLRPGPTFAHGV